MEGLAIGRIVHVRAELDAPAGGRGKCQPAIIVTVWNQDPGTINAQAFRDGSNDDRYDGGHGEPTRWVTSVVPGEGHNTYHDPRACQHA